MEGLKDDFGEIRKKMADGHTYHCACRLVWGDGECECEFEGKLPPMISQQVLAATVKMSKFGK